MHDYNLTQLAGNIARDPEIKHVAVAGHDQKVPVVELTLAVEDGVSKVPGFYTVVAWRGLALAVCAHKKKGDPIFVEGVLETRSWKARDGSKRSRLFVKARLIRFLQRGRGRATPHETRRHEGARAPGGGRPARTTAASAPGRRKQTAGAR